MNHARHLAGLAAAALLPSIAGAQSFQYNDFSNWTGISPVGLTTQAGSVLRLQDDVAPGTSTDNRGAAWYADPVDVSSGFETTFVYQMHMPSTTGGSDGMAFVVQNDQVAGFPMTSGYPDGIGSQALGRHASAAGFGLFTTSNPGESVDNSLAIHLDTYNNGSWGDLDNNHLSVHTGGNADNSQDEAMSLGRATPAFDLNDGLPHTVRVVYVPGTLDVYLDGNLELSVAYDFATGGNYADSGNPVGGLDLIGGTSAYVGFTSGAGSAREVRDVLSWEFASTNTCMPTKYCNPGMGSTNNTATIDVSGCALASGVVLSMANAPANQFAYLLIGDGNTVIQQPPGSKGDLCVAGGGCLGRYSKDIGPIDGSGQYSLDISNSVSGGANYGIPTCGGNIQSGQTWNFQFWHRQPMGTPSTFSEAIRVTFH